MTEFKTSDNKMKTKYYPGKKLKDGSIYVGIMFDEDRKQYYRLAMLPENGPKEKTWNDAVKNPNLPTRKELAAIWSILPVKLYPPNGYYWSSSENGSYGASIQQFSGGGQGNVYKDGTYLVRCVRRFNYSAIQSFDLAPICTCGAGK
jgi:hypothetical protein